MQGNLEVVGTRVVLDLVVYSLNGAVVTGSPQMGQIYFSAAYHPRNLG